MRIDPVGPACRAGLRAGNVWQSCMSLPAEGTCISAAVALAVLAMFMVCLPARAADWPTARGNPQRTGNVDDVARPEGAQGALGL